MPVTPVGKVGVIKEARDPAEVGCFVEVVDDSDGSTGGAYIVGWTADGQGWDGWVEQLDAVDAYVEESGWRIEWFDEVPPGASAGRPRPT